LAASPERDLNGSCMVLDAFFFVLIGAIGCAWIEVDDGDLMFTLTCQKDTIFILKINLKKRIVVYFY